MPTDQEHGTKVAANLTFLNGPPPLVGIDSTWAVTVAFYAAVHLIEQLAARDGLHHTRHTGSASRQGYLATHAIHHVLAADLQALLAASMVARYESQAAFDQAYSAAVVQSQLIDGCLARIQAHVLAHP